MPFPTPLPLLCAILLCLPLAAIFTFTTITSSHDHDDVTTSPLPISNIITQNNKNHILSHSNIKSNEIVLNADEDEMDDSLLLKQASLVDANPKPVKKVAFMFLTTSPLPFAPLWEQFFSRAPKDSFNIYVHANPKLNLTASFQGIFTNRVIPSKPTRRYSSTLVSAARRLLAHALLHDSSNTMFALLSPSCIPLHSFNYTYKTLISNSRKSFIEILNKEPGAYDRWNARGEDVMLPEVGYDDFRIGSQFWVLKRKHARDIVNDTRLWSKFKLPCVTNATCYPDEHYFPTLLSMVDPQGCIPCTLTHVNWRHSYDGHPHLYKASEVNVDLIRGFRENRPRYGDEKFNGSDLWLRRRRHPFLFARKFAAGSVHQLLNMAKDVIFKD